MLCARCVSGKIFAFPQMLASFIRADVPYTHAERLSARLQAVYTHGMGARFGRNFSSGTELVMVYLAFTTIVGIKVSCLHF